MQANQIKRPPKLHELVAEQIEDLIRQNQWQKGSRLPPERELCVQLGVSRTVIRETVRVLVTRGVLKQVPGKGTYVSQNVTEPLKHLLSVFAGSHSSKGYANLFEVRNVLEVEIAGIAAERATPQDIEELQRINRALSVLHRKQSQWSEASLTRYNDLDFEFHLAVAKCTGNDFFGVLLTALSQAFKSTWSEIHVHAEVRSHGLELHEKILNAIRAKDGAAARQATRDNLQAFLADAEENLIPADQVSPAQPVPGAETK